MKTYDVIINIGTFSYLVPNCSYCKWFHARSRRNKRQFCSRIPTMLSCFPLISSLKLLILRHAIALNTPAVCRGGLLQPHSSCTCSHTVHFESAAVSMWACARQALTQVPYGAFGDIVAHGVLVNASLSTWGFEATLEEFAAADAGRSLKHGRDLF